MTVASSRSLAAIAGEYDFGAAGTVVDVGGGRGGLIAAILAANPGVRGVLFDLPHVVAGQIVEATGVGDRCEYVGGSFFEEVPAGGDVYVLADIIHDWDDERAVEILRNCGNAMKPGGRVLLAEAVLPDALEASPAKLMDLEMLVMNVRGAHSARRPNIASCSRAPVCRCRGSSTASGRSTWSRPSPRSDAADSQRSSSPSRANSSS